MNNTEYTAEELFSDFLKKHKDELREKAEEYKKKKEDDNVHSPGRYRLNIRGQEYEVIDLIKGVLDNSDVDNSIAFNWGNALKYLLRWTHKNGVEDLKKCRVYLDWMIGILEDKND